jgi:RNA polymerase sigma-70 factor (ECF subfamily)
VHLNGALEKRRILRNSNIVSIHQPMNNGKIKLNDGKCYNEIVEITGQEWNRGSLIQNGRRNLKIYGSNGVELRVKS